MMTRVLLRYLLIFDVIFGTVCVAAAAYFGTGVALAAAVGVLLAALSTAGLVFLIGWLLDPLRPARSKAAAGAALILKLLAVVGVAWLLLARGLSPLGLVAGVAAATFGMMLGLNLATQSAAGQAAMAELSSRAEAAEAEGQENEDKPDNSG